MRFLEAVVSLMSVVWPLMGCRFNADVCLNARASFALAMMRVSAVAIVLACWSMANH